MGMVARAHNAQILGSGEQVVILNHGFGTDQSVWKHLVPHLVEDYRVLLYDNMGAGTTNPEYFDFTRHTSIEGYVLDLLSLLEELEVKSCIYVGHSVFAMIGAIASITRPDFISKIIMLCGTPRLLKDVDYDGGLEPVDLEQLYEAMKSNYKAWCEGFAPLAVGADMCSEAVQEFSRTLFNIRPDIALCIAHLKFESDTREILPFVTVPCHILQSSQDFIVPVTVSEYMHQKLGGPSVVEVMPVTGHLTHLSAPDIVIPVILRHIRTDLKTA